MNRDIILIIIAIIIVIIIIIITLFFIIKNKELQNNFNEECNDDKKTSETNEKCLHKIWFEDIKCTNNDFYNKNLEYWKMLYTLKEVRNDMNSYVNINDNFHNSRCLVQK